MRKISGIRSSYSQGGADYIHHFTMDYINDKIDLIRLDSTKYSKSDFNKSDKSEFSLLQEFVLFTRDSLTLRSQIEATYSYFKHQQKLINSDTLDTYTIEYLSNALKEKLSKCPKENLSIKPFSKLSKKQKGEIDIGNENPNQIFAVMKRKEIITYICLSRKKVKYFSVFKNLSGKYVFIPFGYFFNS
jgi:hypothetical protein